MTLYVYLTLFILESLKRVLGGANSADPDEMQQNAD